MDDREMGGGSAMPPSSLGGSTGFGAGSTSGSIGQALGQPSWMDQSEPAPADQGSSSTMDQAKEQATQAMDTAKEKAGQVAEQAATKVDAGIDKAAGGLDKAADLLRERGQGAGDGQGGAMQSAATQAADRLDTASQYLKDKDSQQLMSDLEGLVRRKPTETLLVAAGVGFLLSKVVR